jgi:hypothetical protein
MSNFKPQVTYMTWNSRHEYQVEKYGVKTPYITEKFKTYAELKKALAIRILREHIGDMDVFVTRSRRGKWGEWGEKWQLINGKPTIIKKGWQ